MARSVVDPKPENGDPRAMSAVMLFNSVIVGLTGLYASSQSIPLTVSGGVLAVVMTACYLLTVRRRRRRRDGPRTNSSSSSPQPLHARDRTVLSHESEGGMWSVNDEEFDDFFRGELPRLVWLLMKDGAERREAEDIAQAAMLEVWQRRDHIANPRAYVRKAALNAFHEGRRRLREIPADADEQRGLSSVEELKVADQERQVVRLLERLPPKQRLVMALTCDEFTPTEIGEITGIPAGTVRAHLREARSKMRQWLTDEGLL